MRTSTMDNGRTYPVLPGLLLLYAVASLLHFMHNAEFVHDYPNLPAWITRGSVYVVWFGLTAVGVLGYALYRSGRYAVGLSLLAVYAAAGLDGLLHYTLAPMGRHTHAMNFTIWFEVAVATLVLLYLFLIGTRLRIVERRNAGYPR